VAFPDREVDGARRQLLLNPSTTFEGVHRLGDEVEFPPPMGANDWPGPRGDLYPMKPWDRMLPDGQIESEALGRVKGNQHERRSVIQWTEGRWVVVRLPIETDGVDATS